MIKYNWEQVYKHTKGDLGKICDFFRNVYINNENVKNYLAMNEYARKIVENSKSNIGMSFLLDVISFVNNDANASKTEMLVYLDLASKRDLFSYFNTNRKVTGLPIWKAVDYDIEKLKLNSLLYIDDKYINFIYEQESEENGYRL